MSSNFPSVPKCYCLYSAEYFDTSKKGFNYKICRCCSKKGYAVNLQWGVG